MTVRELLEKCESWDTVRIVDTETDKVIGIFCNCYSGELYTVPLKEVKSWSMRGMFDLEVCI